MLEYIRGLLFFSVLPDPSFEEMKKVVCEDERRPPLYEKWKKNKVLLGERCE